jgi:hypothetical protein
MNDDVTEYCKGCGKSLHRRRRTSRHYNDRTICFGVPMQRNLIWALVLICFGVLLILNVLKKPVRGFL